MEPDSQHQSSLPPFTISGAFSHEQRRVAESIWLPLLRRLLPALPRLTSIRCGFTPNGLALQGEGGWLMMLCCLEGQRFPSFMSVRSLNHGRHDDAIRAYREEGGYYVRDDNGGDSSTERLMRCCIRALGAKIVGSQSSSIPRDDCTISVDLEDQ